MSVNTSNTTRTKATDELEGDEFFFEPKWFKKYGIKGYWIRLGDGRRNFDSGFLQELKESVRKKYDTSKKILLTASDIEELRGEVGNGKHRLFILDQLLQEGVPLPEPFPVEYANVNSWADVIALRLHYEQESLRDVHKSPKVAKENIKLQVEELREIFKKQNGGGSLDDYIESTPLLDIDDKEFAHTMIKEIEKAEKLLERRRLEESTKPKSNKPITAGGGGAPASSWGQVETRKTGDLDPNIELVGTAKIQCIDCPAQFDAEIQVMKDGTMRMRIPGIPEKRTPEQNREIKLQKPQVVTH